LLDIEEHHLGQFASVERGYLTLLTVRVDVLVWHEMEDHPAILFCGFYPDLRV